MKKIILALTFLSLNVFANTTFDSIESCQTAIEEHVQLKKDTIKLLKEFNNETNKELTPFQVLQFQDSFEYLYNDTINLQFVACEKTELKELLIQSDYLDFSRYIFSDFKLRRIARTMLNENNSFYNFKENYAHYTKQEILKENVEKFRNSFSSDLLLELAIDLDFKKSNSITRASDIIVNGISSTVSSIANGWGKLSDATIWRSGRLKDNREAYDLIVTKLRPFDILFESRNYTLSHFTIPGHFGHVAIWMGTKEELVTLGLWDQEFMIPFREHIERGENIIEFRKQGMQFQSLETFINLDEIAVTRIKGIEQNGQNIFLRLIQQFGKEYDFAFNAHSTDKITCAELITFTYGDIQWPVISKASVVNIRPDDIALYTVLNKDKSEFVAFLVGNKDKKSFESFDSEAFDKIFKK